MNIIYFNIFHGSPSLNVDFMEKGTADGSNIAPFERRLGLTLELIWDIYDINWLADFVYDHCDDFL